MDTVESICMRMMQADPHQYATRADCLMHLFTAGGTRWTSDGCLTFINETAELARHASILEDENAVIAMLRHNHAIASPRRSCETDMRLAVRRSNAAANFVLNNAELLAQERNSRLSRAPNPVFARFDDMPDDAHHMWSSAGTELAITVCEYVMSDPYVSQNHETRVRVQMQIDAAQARCSAFLMRLKNGGTDEARAVRLDVLRREADALGFALVARTPVAPDNATTEAA